MPGIHTKLVDLGKSALKMTRAMQAEDARKRSMINEFRNTFVRQGFSPWMATNLAEEKYRTLHIKAK